jgi:hypothetical protein
VKTDEDFRRVHVHDQCHILVSRDGWNNRYHCVEHPHIHDVFDVIINTACHCGTSHLSFKHPTHGMAASEMIDDCCLLRYMNTMIDDYALILNRFDESVIVDMTVFHMLQ